MFPQLEPFPSTNADFHSFSVRRSVSARITGEKTSIIIYQEVNHKHLRKLKIKQAHYA